MKHFIVIIDYTVSTDRIKEVLEDHRQHLEEGYQSGMLLVSGYKIPWNGGLIIGKANSLEEIKAFCEKDPYYTNHYASFTYQEFVPMKHRQEVYDWFFN